jgi:hypothetical protein
MPNLSQEELQQKADWLETGHYDTTEALGNVATRIIIEQPEGTWIVPLKGGIDVLDSNDNRFITTTPVWAKVVRNEDGQTSIEASYLATDDETRSATVDLDAASFDPKQ